MTRPAGLNSDFFFFPVKKKSPVFEISRKCLGKQYGFLQVDTVSSRVHG